MSGQAIDSTPFRDLLRPDEVLIWSAKPVLLPLSPKAWVFLLALAALGLFGAVQIGLTAFHRFDIGPGAFRITERSPKLDFLIALALVAAAAIAIGTTRADRRHTRRKVFALSKDRLFIAMTGGRKSSVSVATRFPQGQLDMERTDILVDLSIEVRGLRMEEDFPPRYAFHGLSPADADRALIILNAPEVTK